MTAVAFDITKPETVAHALEEANRRLAREKTVPDSVLGLVTELSAQIGETSPEDRAAAGVSAEAWIAVQSAALRALNAGYADDDERHQRGAMRRRLEELRFYLSRLAERDRVADEQPIEAVVRWIDDVLSVPQGVKAQLLGVHDRKYQRWTSESDASRPAGDDERRVRLVARLVTDLRPVLTAVGVVRWLQEKNAGLNERRPLELVAEGDPGELQRLFDMVAAARAGAAG